MYLLISLTVRGMGMNVLWLSRDDVAGRLAGRTSDDEITVFDPMGLAVPDVASALVVYEKAKSRGVGS